MTNATDRYSIERILPLLRCPECHHHPLTSESGDASFALYCPVCGRAYPQRDGVLDLLAGRERTLANQAFGRWAAAAYDLSAAQSGFRRLYRRRFADEVEQYTHPLDLRPTDVVIDVGCGTGNYTLEFAKKVREGMAIGVDVSQAMLERFQRHAAEAEQRNVVALLASAENLPFRDGCLHHLFPAVEPALAETHRCLESGGIFLGSTFFEPGPPWLKPVLRFAGLTIAARPVAAPALGQALQAAGFAGVKVVAGGLGQFFFGTYRATRQAP